MASALYLYPDEVPWVLDLNQSQAAPRLEEGAPEGFNGIVLVPCEELLLTEILMPIRNRSHLQQALPYMVEESLASRIEEIHCAFATEGKNHVLGVAAVAHTRMSQWLAQAKEEGWEIRFLLPDVLALPWQQDTWSLLALPGRLLARTSAATGWALDSAMDSISLRIWFEAALREQPSTRMVLYRGAEPLHPTLLQSLQGLGVPVEEQIHAAGWGAWLCQGLSARQQPAWQLLQGPYQQRNLAFELWHPWRLTMVLLGGWLLAQGTAIFYHDWKVRAEHTALQTQLHQMYQTTFPQARNIVAPRLQMERQLNTLQQASNHGSAESPFFSLLSKLAQAASLQTGLIIQRLEYRKQAFYLHVSLPQIQQLENLKQHLQQQNTLVELISAETYQNRVDAHLRMQLIDQSTQPEVLKSR